MEKLKQYIELQLKYATDSPDVARAMYDHAFGAVDFYIRSRFHPEEEEELIAYWDTIRPQFEMIIWGL